MTVQKQPKAEWGRYAMTPRIVRTQYKDLSHAEKWLYVCLKDLCGDKGVCFRALRVLSEETDISTGSLSAMIPHLHAAGLIHAEKKRRSNNPTAKEVWHITIVDIWQANVQECSKSEHHEDENVQNLNEIATECSIIEQQCSENEPKRSNFVDRRIHTEEDKMKNISSLSVDPMIPTLSPSLNAQDDAVEFSDDMPLLAVSPLVAPATRLKPSRSVELSPEQKQRARAIKAKIEDRCGVLTNAGPNIAENKAIAKLVQKYAQSDIDDVEHYLIHCHFKWSKPDFKFKIRGNVLLDEMEPTLKLFAENPKLRDATSSPANNFKPAQQEGMKYKRLPPVPTFNRQVAGVR